MTKGAIGHMSTITRSNFGVGLGVESTIPTYKTTSWVNYPAVNDNYVTVVKNLNIFIRDGKLTMCITRNIGVFNVRYKGWVRPDKTSCSIHKIKKLREHNLVRIMEVLGVSYHEIVEAL